MYVRNRLTGNTTPNRTSGEMAGNNAKGAVRCIRESMEKKKLDYEKMENAIAVICAELLDTIQKAGTLEREVKVEAFRFDGMTPDAVNTFAVGMGFRNKEHLENFLARNPVIWGNKHGALLFKNAIAFNEGDRKYEKDTEILPTTAAFVKWASVLIRFRSARENNTIIEV